MDSNDPRTKSNKYFKGASIKFNNKNFDFSLTQFLIDDNYVGEPPHVQVSIENLNDNIDENFLRRELAKLGQIRTLEIVRHRDTKQHLGFAKVQFEASQVAQNCVDTFNGKQLMGRQLKVYKDVRFANIDESIHRKLNPAPTLPILPPILVPPQIPSQIPPPLPILPTALAAVAAANAGSVGLTPTTPPTPQTPAQITIPLPTGRQRLDDRIAILFKQPNNVGSYNRSWNSVAPPEFKPIKEIAPSPEFDIHAIKDTKPLLRPFKPIAEPEPIPEPMPIKVESLDLELPEEQIDIEVLPFCFEAFITEMKKKSLETVKKKLVQELGYRKIDEAQNEYKKQQTTKRLEEASRHKEAQTQQMLNERYMSKVRAERAGEFARPKIQVSRTRKDNFSVVQENIRPENRQNFKRVNRSSALVPEFGRRGSHHTSLNSSPTGSHGSTRSSRASDRSSSSSSSSRSTSSSSNSSSSSRSSSSSGSTSSSRSTSSSSQYSRSNSVSSQSSIDSDEVTRAKFKVDRRTNESISSGIIKKGEFETSRDVFEEEVARSLLELAHQPGPPQGASSNIPHVRTSMSQNHDLDRTKPLPNATTKKRKKKMDVDSENRSVKKFASSITRSPGLRDDNRENAMDEEAKSDPKPIKFDMRSEELIQRMTDDLTEYLDEEDIRYLKKIHEEWVDATYGNEISVPFGSETQWQGELEISTRVREIDKMLKDKRRHNNPAWWNGCSRCSAINISEEEKVVEYEDYEDMTKAPIKSHVIQAATSTRRDQRGDQRRIAALNPEIDPVFLKQFTSNTLQMRAKNLRFSRSKIHKWGLFACEKIANGDAVIEYVGEKIRPSVADHREKQVYANLPTHDGSSYFFRVDYDVIDATLKGNKARFINHSCNPNCIAKVIKHENGSNSIVIYAKQAIEEDEEITYDYKFPIEEQKIECNCKAPNCKRYLN